MSFGICIASEEKIVFMRFDLDSHFQVTALKVRVKQKIFIVKIFIYLALHFSSSVTSSFDSLLYNGKIKTVPLPIFPTVIILLVNLDWIGPSLSQVHNLESIVFGNVLQEELVIKIVICQW